MRYYVEINGESSLDIQGLMIQSLPSISKPLMRSKQETIDGRDGDIVTKLGYSAYDKTLKIGLWGNYDINKVIAFFNQEGTITFSNEPDKYYRFTILNRDDYVSQLDKFRTCTIALHCQPYKYKLNEEAEELENEYVEQEGTNLTFSNTLEAPMNIDLKGNTLQNGTPTPSSPIPINNVSGDNNIVVSNENLKSTGTIYSYYFNASSFTASNRTLCIPIEPNTTYYIKKSMVSNRFRICLTNDVPSTSTSVYEYQDVSTQTETSITNTNYAYLNIFFWQNGDTYTEEQIYDSLNIYTQGTTYNIDLPVENLFDKDNANIENGYIDTVGMVLITSQLNRLFYIPCKPNTTYTISRSIITSTFRVATYDSTPFPSTTSSSLTYSISGLIKDNSATSITITTGANAKYLIVHYGRLETDTNIEESLATIQVELGTKPNTYTPYGTTPIELNKIGTYQDYFYKDNDKWYLHKETKKLDMSTIIDWVKTDDGSFFKSGFVDTYGIKRDTLLSNIFQYSTENWYDNGYFGIASSGNMWVKTGDSSLTTATAFTNWLSNKGAIMYGILTTPTNTEITYTPLIEQLESIKNAMSKEGTTNVNQVNNDAPFIITASVLSGTDSITLTNEGNTTSKPTLTITGSGVVGVYLENIQMFNISLGTNETIIIDTENMEAYYGSQLKNRQVTGDYSNFALQSGTNNLKFTGLVTNVEITNYNRWI